MRFELAPCLLLTLGEMGTKKTAGDGLTSDEIKKIIEALRAQPPELVFPRNPAKK